MRQEHGASWVQERPLGALTTAEMGVIRRSLETRRKILLERRQELLASRAVRLPAGDWGPNGQKAAVVAMREVIGGELQELEGVLELLSRENHARG